MNLSLNEFVLRSRNVSELSFMLNLYHDRILDIIHHWEPDTQDSVQNVEFIKEIDELAGWIVQIRDKYGSIQERDIAYGCWIVWYLLFPEWALRILDQFVNGVGCWSDIKYICEFLNRPCISSYVVNKDKERITNVLLKKLVHKLYSDKQIWSNIMSDYFENRLQFFSKETPSGSRIPLMNRPNARKHLSLVAKWVPRESSKHGWLFLRMVHIWAKKHGERIREPRVERKWCRSFRQTLSALNRELDTLEIKMCSNQWEGIDPLFLTYGSLDSHFPVLLKKSKVFLHYVLDHPGQFIDPIMKFLTVKCQWKLSPDIVPLLNVFVAWNHSDEGFDSLFDGFVVKANSSKLESSDILPWIALDEPVGSAAWWWAGFIAQYSSLKKIVVTTSVMDDLRFREPYAVLSWLKSQGIDIIKTHKSNQESITDFQLSKLRYSILDVPSVLKISYPPGLTVLLPSS